MDRHPQPGDHLISPRIGYTHHGISAGEGRVIHYSGLYDGRAQRVVEEVRLTEFEREFGFSIRERPDALFSKPEIVGRARGRLGEELYDLAANNCEHFVEWCITGDQHSRQVSGVATVGTAVATSMVGLATRSAVAAGGPVVGLSAPGVMSGLAAAGGAVGGGVVAGIGLLGGISGIAGASLLGTTVLKDNDAHTHEERNARKAGRAASYVGAGVGAIGGIGAVAASGSVAGLSAAGISSGLAAIGSVFGGGMALGATVVTAAPLAVAVVFGLGAHKLYKQWRSEDKQSSQS